MGSPLGSSLANAFLAQHEQNWLDSCALEYRPLYYQRYVDVILALFKPSDHLKQFQSYLNSYHVNMYFDSTFSTLILIAFTWYLQNWYDLHFSK